MAYGTKYKLTFKDVTGLTHYIYIMPKDYVGAVIDISSQGYSNPFVIDWPVVDKMEPIRGSGAIIKFYAGGIDFSDLYTIDSKGIQVKLYNYQGGIEWSGYLNTEDYTEDYSDNDALIELSANDGLAMIKREKYFTDTSKPYQKGRETFGNIIEACLTDVEFYEYLFISDLKEENDGAGAADSMWWYHKADLSNYIDEDGTSMTKREVLETVLKKHGLTIAITANYCWMFNASELIKTTVQTKRIDRSLVYQGELHINNKIDYSAGEFDFLDSSQQMSIIAGINELVFNYSPYPDSKKVIPAPVRDFYAFIPNNAATPYWFFADDSTASHADENEGFILRRADGDWFSGNEVNGWLLADNDRCFICELKRGIEGDVLDNTAVNKPYLGIRDFLTPAATTPHIIVAGGHIEANGDTITIRFTVRYEIDEVLERPIGKLQWPMRVKIGSKYGTGGGGILSMTSSTSVWAGITVTDLSKDLRSRDITAELRLIDITESGNITIEIARDCVKYNNTLGGYGLYVDSIYEHLMFSDFEVLVNDIEINDTDQETVGINDVNYTQNKTIELNHGDYREGGILDRGLITVNGEPAKNWYLISEGSSIFYSLHEILLRMYLSEYGESFRQLSANITCDYMFRKNVSSWNKCLLPITVIKDTNHQGSRQFLNVGGSFDVQLQEYNGTFDELKGITETIS